MNKTTFCIEELTLIKAAGAKLRCDAVKLISNGIPYAEDEISAEIARNCVTKLLAISDEEFAKLDLSEADILD